jgi:hypothetical protein
MSVSVGTSIVTSNLLLEFDPANVKSYQENLMLYSQDVTQSSWGRNAVTVTSGFIAPDGTSTAQRFYEDATNNFHLLSQSISCTATTYTVSVYVKAGERTKGYIQILNANNVYVDFDLTTGTYITGGLTAQTTSKTMTYVGNGWYRVSATGPMAAAAATVYLVILNASGTAVYTGDNSSGMFMWGAQVNLGNLSPYTPTTTAAVSQTIFDLLGNGYTSTSYNSPTFSSVGNSSISLNGTNQSFSITKPNPNGGGQISLDMWIYLNSISTTPVIIHKGSHFVFVIYTTNTYSYADSSNYNFGNYGSRTATGIGKTGVWKHIVVTKDISSVVRVYLNGSLADTSPVFGSGISQTTSTLWIGGYSDTDTNPSVNMINGYVGPYKIYNIALTADQVTQNFNATRSRFGI